MNNIHVGTKLLFILVRDTSLDGYKHVSDYLKDQYDAELIDDSNGQLKFNNQNKKLLFELTYSGYITYI